MNTSAVIGLDVITCLMLGFIWLLGRDQVKHASWPRRLAFFSRRRTSRCLQGPIHTKNARLFCCGNSAADLSKPHTFKWDPLADDVLEAA